MGLRPNASQLTSDDSNFLTPYFKRTIDKNYVTLKIEEISSKNPFV